MHPSIMEKPRSMSRVLCLVLLTSVTIICPSHGLAQKLGTERSVFPCGVCSCTKLFSNKASDFEEISMNCSSKHLSTIPDDAGIAFANSTRVLKIDLSLNPNLSEIKVGGDGDTSICDIYPDVQELSLAFDEFEEIPSLLNKGCAKLRTLNLTGNLITSLEADDLQDVVGLRQLHGLTVTTSVAKLALAPLVVIIPGPVSDVKLTIVPFWGSLLGLVSWQPPAKLGSAGVVSVYHLFWGTIDLMRHDLISGFKTVLGHITVPGTELNADLQINITRLGMYETIGVLVRAAAPGQVIDSPFGDITLASNTISPTPRTRHTLLQNADVVILQLDDSGQRVVKPVEVEVFWRRPPLRPGVNTTAFGVKWGRVREGRGMENATSEEEFELLTGNFTVSGGG